MCGRREFQPGISPSSLSSSRTSSRVASAGGRIRSESSRESSASGVAGARVRRRAARPSAAANASSSPASTAASTSASSALRRVELVVGDLELTLAQDPDDHDCCSFSAGSAPGGARPGRGGRGCRSGGVDGRRGAPPLSAASSASTSAWRAHRLQLAGDVVAAVDRAGVVERAGGDQLVDGAGPGLHLRGLVLGALHRHADVAHLLGDAGERLVDAGLRLGGGVGRLDGLLAGAEGLDLGLQPLRGEGELLLLALELGVLRLEVGRSGRCSADLRVSASRARSSRPIESAFCACSVSLSDCGLQLVDLELDPLAAGGDVGDAAAHLRAASRAAAGSCSRGSRAGPRPCRAPCWPWPGRSG